MNLINHNYQLFENFLSQNPLSRPPINLYAPADYIMSLGGKRLRPILSLIGFQLYNDNSENGALQAAMAVEVFHNFTLLHDDIMDASDIRRGQLTVHKKFGTNTAILTGDVMLIQSFQYLLYYNDPGLVKQLLDVFNKMAIEVCEGQQMDMDFEKSQTVNIEDYILMITYKTAVLMGASIQLGAILGGASAKDQEHLYEFAKNFGIAFQLRDDFLDCFGDTSILGKKIGGDILQNKKTYLFIKASMLADEKQKQTLIHYYDPLKNYDENEKIDAVLQVFNEVNVKEYCQQVTEAYRDLALSHLMACNIDHSHKESLSAFLSQMLDRTF